MKCTQCGCTEFINTSFIKEASTTGERKTYDYFEEPDLAGQVLGYQFTVRGDANGYFQIVGNCQCFVCKNCGHVELFAKDFVERYEAKEIADAEEARRQKEEQEQLQRDHLEFFDFLDKVEKELPELKKLTENESISVKKHKEAVEKYNYFKRWLSDWKRTYSEWEKDPKRIQQKWLSIKKEVECFK